MDAKRVLMVSCEGLGRGGVQAVMMAIVRSMNTECIFDALLFTDEKRYYEDEFTSYGGTIYRIPFYSGSNRVRRKLDYLVRGVYIYHKLLKIFQISPKYDVIHCNNQYESAICIKAAQKAGVPIRIVHTHVITTPSRFLIKNCVNSFYKYIINKYATHCIGCSELACTTFYGKGRKWIVINNPYDEKRFDPKQYTYSRPSRIVLTQIGSYSINKNQVFSLEIIRKILDNGEDVRLNFVGFGEYLAVIKSQITELNLHEYVNFYPHDANTPAILNESFGLIFPSIQEGFGIVLIEAQAMGVRCYASDAVPAITDCGGVAYLSLAQGAEAWARQIINDYRIDGQSQVVYDCSAFSAAKVIESYRMMYEIGKYDCDKSNIDETEKGTSSAC